MLINLSNHPSEYWDQKQRQAAGIYGEVVDLPFPCVDPSGDETYIEHLADECMAGVLRLRAGHRVVVHLMGEMTLTVALLRRLKEEGIPCVASTSWRKVEEEQPGKKRVTFAFERFRTYTL
ncbi:MAG: hypothetical protein LIP08_04825 [Bacteroides sp.]|nr:hypothetical protein [Bacteroides sp.]